MIVRSRDEQTEDFSPRLNDTVESLCAKLRISLGYLDTDTCQINIHETTHIFHDRLSGISRVRTLHFSRSLGEKRSPPPPKIFIEKVEHPCQKLVYIVSIYLYFVSPNHFHFANLAMPSNLLIFNLLIFEFTKYIRISYHR